MVSTSATSPTEWVWVRSWWHSNTLSVSSCFQPPRWVNSPIAPHCSLSSCHVAASDVATKWVTLKTYHAQVNSPLTPTACFQVPCHWQWHGNSINYGVVHSSGCLLYSLVFMVSFECSRDTMYIDTLLHLVCTFLTQYHHIVHIYVLSTLSKSKLSCFDS